MIVGLAIYHLLFKRDAYYSWNRKLLISILLGSLLLPYVLLQIDSLSTASQLPKIQLPEALIGTEASAQNTTTTLSTLHLLYMIYVVGVLAHIVFNIKQFIAIRSIRRGASKRIWKGIPLYVHTNEHPPFSFNNAIYLKQSDLENPNVEALLTHEAIHVKERHSLDIIFIQCIQALLWFNPVFYLLKKELQLTHEYICDQKAIFQVPESEYRIALLSYTLADTGIHIAQSFNQLKLKRRFSMMKKQKSGKIGLKVILLIPILGASIVLLSAMVPIKPNKVITDAVMFEKTETIEKPVTDPVFTQPQFPGGDQAMFSFIANNVKYPEEAKTAGIQGRVFVKFVVKKNGKVSKVGLKRGIASENSAARLVEQEAIRVVELMPNWTPGTENGKAVAMEMALPIKFQLQ
jgi:TonB family protein